MKDILSVRNLSIYYETSNSVIKAVKGVSFNVRQNECFGLVGESGSGKSTLCSGILHLISKPGKIKSGRILFDGNNLLEVNKRELQKLRWKEISYVPQGTMNSLNPVINIGEQFYDVIRAHEDPPHQSSKILKEKVITALNDVYLKSDVIYKYPHELSGGMIQRACIALAMILNPKLIIADEPTSALDVVSKRIVFETLLKLQQNLSASIILVGHDMALQAQISSRLGVMYAGNLIEVGDVKTIFNNPLHPYTQRLISSIPSVNKKQNIHKLATNNFSEEEKIKYQKSKPLNEVEPGHFVVQYN